MPNWCLNNLEIIGSKEQVKEVLEFVKGGKDSEGEINLFDFNKIIPMPKELIDMTSPVPKEQKTEQKKLKKKYGAGNWYDWAIDNWGTKWDSSDVEIIDNSDDNIAQIHFSTAWSPPCPVIAALGKKFPKVSFILEYFEPGMCFAGRFNVEGKHISEDQYDNGSEAYKKMAEDFGCGEEEVEETEQAT